MRLHCRLYSNASHHATHPLRTTTPQVPLLLYQMPDTMGVCIRHLSSHLSVCSYMRPKSLRETGIYLICIKLDIPNTSTSTNYGGHAAYSASEHKKLKTSFRPNPFSNSTGSSYNVYSKPCTIKRIFLRHIPKNSKTKWAFDKVLRT